MPMNDALSNLRFNYEFSDFNILSCFKIVENVVTNFQNFPSL